MVKRIMIIWVVAVSMFLTRLQAQEVRMGQLVPDAVFSGVLNHKAPTLRLSDFRGKWVILDFWNTRCLGCILSFPKIDSLQQQFAGKLQFILVNRESTDTTRQFFERRKKIRMPEVPLITGDRTLAEWFPHTGVPHLVWIDGSGTVRAITHSENLTAENIRKLLEGQTLDLAQKADVGGLRSTEPLLAQKNGLLAERTLYYSSLMPSVDGLTGIAWNTWKGPERNHVRLNDASIATLFTFAYSEGGRYDFAARNSIVLEVGDTSAYWPPPSGEGYDKWRKNFSFCYELIVPQAKASDIYTHMQRDLERYFDVEASVQKREVVCLALVRTSKKDKLASKGGASKNNMWSAPDKGYRYVNNQPFSRFLSVFRLRYNKTLPFLPFADATGYRGHINLKLSADALDNMNIESLRSELKAYDLDLVPKTLIREVLVIRERKGK